MDNQLLKKNIINVSYRIKPTLEEGFTMVEVLIALVLSTIALLGLAVGQLKSLQYATNSFNYTVSLIQANNAVERTWNNLCNLQSVALPILDPVSAANLQPQVNDYTMVLVPAAGGAFNNNLNVTVSWTDTRLADVNVNLNQVAVDAAFPQLFPGKCV
jgi:type IV pilus assembly protein PilV